MDSLVKLGAALALTASLFAPPTQAEPVGWGSDGAPLVTVVPFSGIGWVIGAPTAPIGITAVPSHSPWIKRLEVPTFVPFSTVFEVIEHLVVGQPGNPGPAWTDWHEHILRGSGWDWVSGQILVGGVVVATGELGEPDLGPDLGHSPEIWFDFAPLQPGTQLEIRKQIHCHTQPFCNPQDPIEIIEYPTIRIPEPSLPLLIGLALLALVRRRPRS